MTEKITKKYRPLSTFKSFINHARWVIGETGWLEIADYVSEWLESTTTSSCRDALMSQAHGAQERPYPFSNNYTGEQLRVLAQRCGATFCYESLRYLNIPAPLAPWVSP